MNLRWIATRIAGETLENDGVCMDGEASIGRVRMSENRSKSRQRPRCTGLLAEEL